MNEKLSRAEIELFPVPPYNFDHALAYLRTSASSVLEKPDQQVYRRAIIAGGSPVLLTMSSVGSLEKPRLWLTVEGEVVGERQVAEAEQFVRRVFHLDVDPAPFYAVALGEPKLAEIVTHFYGLRPVLIAYPYESLLWAIIGQQVNVAFARKLKLALVELCGHTMPVNGVIYNMLPPATDVANLDPEVLRQNQFSRQKLAYLVNVSRAVAAGEFHFDSLVGLDEEAAIASLTAHKGVGRWTAEYVLMRGLGARDSIPAADMGLRAIMGKAYGLNRNATEAEVREFALQWAGWRAWATFFWWLALQSGFRFAGQLLA